MIFSYALAATFIIHGLAHVSGFTTAWTSKNADFKDEPWLFAKGIPLHTRAGKTFGLLWLLAAVLLIASGIGLLLRGLCWPTLAPIGSVVSLVAIVPWWRAVVPGVKAGRIRLLDDRRPDLANQGWAAGCPGRTRVPGPGT
jgi:hypothetical protein